MIERFRTLLQLPGQMQLAWRLFVDPRVPALSKVMAGGAVVLILSPLDLFDWIPVIGGASSVALLALVLRSFINAAPEDVCAEHEQALSLRSAG